jgi:hypothetical protein
MVFALSEDSENGSGVQESEGDFTISAAWQEVVARSIHICLQCLIPDEFHKINEVNQPY